MSNCERCGKVIVTGPQNILALEPRLSTSEDITYEGHRYHSACLDEKLDSQNLLENPSIKLDTELKASEMLSLVTRLGLDEPDLGSSKLRKTLINKLAEHNTLYIKCMNHEHCTTGIIRRHEAYVGPESTKVASSTMGKQIIDKEHKHSKVREVFYFCSAYCDVNFASRLRARIELEKAEKAKKQKTDDTLTAVIKQLIATKDPNAKAKLGAMLDSMGIANPFSEVPPPPPAPPVEASTQPSITLPQQDSTQAITPPLPVRNVEDAIQNDATAAEQLTDPSKDNV